MWEKQDVFIKVYTPAVLEVLPKSLPSLNGHISTNLSNEKFKKFAKQVM